MPQIPIFHGRVTDEARLELLETERDQRRIWLGSLTGKTVDVVIRLHRNQRSLDQNAWIWGVAYPLIAEALGYDKDEHEQLHYALVDECFGRSFDARIGREVPNVRSSKLDTGKFSEYMEWLVRWAAREHAIVVPLPNESEAA